MTQHFDFNPSHVLAAITSRYFAVPQYQRSYSWGDRQLEDFWLDMQRSINDSGEYFLGSFVLSSEDGAEFASIIDGQQRIATTTILLAAMRDIYRENGKSGLANSIDGQYLKPHDVERDEYRCRLKLNAVDNPFYKDVTLDGKDIKPQADSHIRLKFAKDYFRDRLNDIVSSHPAHWSDRLSEITRYLNKQARVVVVETATDADAFTIFETLNDCGADLTIADLLKNYLFSRAKTELDSVQYYWMEAGTTLASAQEEKEFVPFLRQLWSSYYGVTRERDLYRDIKARVITPSNAVAFGKQIRDGATVYRAIISSDPDYWSAYDKSTKERVSLINGLNVQQTRPLILAILSTLSHNEASKLLRNLASWVVRLVVAGGSGGGQAERYFAEGAVQVRNGKIKTAEELLAILGTVIPNDSVFRSAFSVLRVTRNPQARYYLQAIEKHLRNIPDPELILNEDAKDVNLEHILPQKPAPKQWDVFSDDESSAYAYRLGNMTLLRKSENQKLGNGEWESKRLALVGSQLKLNQAISHLESWDKKAIDERQLQFSEWAVQVWPRLS